jgi:ribosome maturation factor RimP
LRQKLLKRGPVSPLFVYTIFSMEPASEIRRFVEEKLSPDQFLVDIVISARKGPKKVSVIVDGDNGISIENCAELSRQLSKYLDDSGLIEDNYLLEVTSPGVDHPLASKRQFTKNVGRLLKVKTENQVLEGKLTSVSEDAIVLTQEIGSGKEKETKTTEILFNKIEKALVQVSFK